MGAGSKVDPKMFLIEKKNRAREQPLFLKSEKLFGVLSSSYLILHNAYQMFREYAEFLVIQLRYGK